MACGLDLNDPQDLLAFVQCRRNLFELNPNLHPVLAKAIARMTELDRHRRPQDLSAVLRTLENYRDQDVDFDFDLARSPGFQSIDRRGRRALILVVLCSSASSRSRSAIGCCNFAPRRKPSI